MSSTLISHSRVIVTVVEGKSLPAADKNGYSDPFVIVTIPNTTFKEKTRTLDRTVDPYWHDRLKFEHVNLFKDLATTLRFEVYDHNMFLKNQALGWAELELKNLREWQVYEHELPLGGPGAKGSIVVKIQIQRMRDQATAKKLSSEIDSHCKEHKTKFEDPEFPAAASSIYKTGAGPHIEKIAGWKRPSELAPSPKLFVDGVEAGDVIQGALGDCYFLGSISVIATRKDLLQPLFVKYSPENGYCQIKFFKNLAWQYVTVDDRIPVSAANKPIYGSCKDPNEQWVPLIEKAYAKLHGCYEAIESGNIAVALSDLTSESCSTFEFDDPDTKKSLTDGKMWEQIQYFVKEEYLMGCSFNTKDGDSTEKENPLGLMHNHAYGILKAVQVDSNLKLICIRNPWGEREWKGAWSDNSKEWTPALIKKLNVVFADDGTFWMEWSDFIREFNNFQVVRLLQDKVGKKWHPHKFLSEWNRQTAGGSTNHPTWHDNPQYSFTTSKRTKLFVDLSQPDARLQWKKEYAIPLGVYVFKTKNPNMHKTVYAPEDLVSKTAFAPNRDCTLSVDLDPKTSYIVIPATFSPGIESEFYLSMYFEEDVDDCGPIKSDHKMVLRGQWKGQTAGGCMNHQTWVNNPKWKIWVAGCEKEPPKKTVSLSVTVRQPDRKPELFYIGLYAGVWTGPINRKSATKIAQNTDAREVGLELEVLPTEWPYFILPNTFDPNEESEFEIIIYSTVEMKSEMLYQ